jgi:hypothetical protein
MFWLDLRRIVCLQAPHADTIRRYIEVQAVLLAPICPHISEHVWRVILGNTTSVFKARWPTAGPIDSLILQSKYALRIVCAYSLTPYLLELAFCWVLCFSVFLQVSIHAFRTQLLKSKTVTPGFRLCDAGKRHRHRFDAVLS